MTFDWQEYALCAQTDPDIFTPGSGESAQPAKRICARCEVVEQCLALALETKKAYGVWGGKTVTERNRIRKARVDS